MARGRAITRSMQRVLTAAISTPREKSSHQQQVANAAAAAPTGKPIPLVTKLAYRNLFHDRMSLIAGGGIVFSVVLIAGYASIQA
jgi:hypothetical protein